MKLPVRSCQAFQLPDLDTIYLDQNPEPKLSRVSSCLSLAVLCYGNNEHSTPLVRIGDQYQHLSCRKSAVRGLHQDQASATNKNSNLTDCLLSHFIPRPKRTGWFHKRLPDLLLLLSLAAGPQTVSTAQWCLAK